LGDLSVDCLEEEGGTVTIDVRASVVFVRGLGLPVVVVVLDTYEQFIGISRVVRLPLGSSLINKARF